MYKIYADEILIYDDTSSDPFYKVASPRLTLEKGAPGSLKMTIPPGCAGYDLIVRMATNIRVEKNGNEIWAGRAIQESKDFWNQQQITCEGELAYFNDSIQPQHQYDLDGQGAFFAFLKAITDEHNIHVTDDRKIFVGSGESVIRTDIPQDGIHITTNYENTLSYMSKIVNDYGGYFKIHKNNGIRYLDYVDDSLANATAQKIEFGKNLMDFTKSFDSTDFATVVIPLGAKQETSEVEGVDSYLTVKDERALEPGHDSPDGAIYVEDTASVANYGWIEKVVHWDEETDAQQLMKRAEAYLDGFRFETMTLEVSALDLHYLNPEIQDISIGEIVYVVSTPHGINLPFPVNKLDIPLDQPQNTIFQLGAEEKVSLTATTKKDNTQLLQAIDEALNKDEILEAAKAQATALMNQNLNGYVTIMTMDDDPQHPEAGPHSEAIYISETIPLEKNPAGSSHPYNVQRFWKWGFSGLGYTDNWGESFKTAITMDGSILGERIAAGSIHGSKISAGTLSLVASSGETGMTIGVETGGPTSYIFEHGDLSVESGQEGHEIDSAKMARLAYKVYLKHGAVVSISNTSYMFQAFQYSDNTTDESGCVPPPSGFQTEFKIEVSNYYRFVVGRTDDQVLQDSDIRIIESSFSLGNSTQAVIKANDLKIIGMVTFEALENESSSSDPPYRRTVINGDYIRTGHVTGDRIDAKKLVISKEIEEEGTTKTVTTFQVTAGGDVIIGGGASILFDDGTTSTLDSIGGEEIAKSIANGTYAGNTFIGGRTIYSPDAIISNELVAQAATGRDQELRAGRFVLRDKGLTEQATYDRLVIRYTDQTSSDTPPGVYFETNDRNSFHFNRSIETTHGITIAKSTSPDAPDPISSIGGSVFFSQGSTLNMNNGIMILGHYVTYFDNYQDLLTRVSRPQVGQIAFVLN